MDTLYISWHTVRMTESFRVSGIWGRLAGIVQDGYVCYDERPEFILGSKMLHRNLAEDVKVPTRENCRVKLNYVLLVVAPSLRISVNPGTQSNKEVLKRMRTRGRQYQRHVKNWDKFLCAGPIFETLPSYIKIL